jgi:16S rRNA (guanine966-N2)-methyltransferase
VRIISGFARGTKISSPRNNEQRIRPTSARAREALFNIIGAMVKNARVLDLYAGTGAFGLEAFSRGAASIFFVDNSDLAIGLIKKNVLHVLKGYTGQSEIRVVQHNLLHQFSPDTLGIEPGQHFDVIFADPPYDTLLSCKTLEFINNSSLLHTNGILIVEERYERALPEELAELRCVDKRKYGEAGFSFYCRKISQ